MLWSPTEDCQKGRIICHPICQQRYAMIKKVAKLGENKILFFAFYV